MKKSVMFLAILILLCGTAIISRTQLVDAVYTTNSTIYIRADGSIDPPTAPIQRNGSLYALTSNITVTVNTAAITIQRNNTILNGEGYTIKGSRTDPSCGVNLSEVTNVTVINTNINYTCYAVLLNSSKYNTISGNNITSSGYGVYLSDSSDNAVSRNNITERTATGIHLISSFNNTITENSLENNWNGLCLWYSRGNTVFQNKIMANTNFGIQMINATDSRITQNAIKNNGQVGIGMQTSSDSNSICSNDIVNDAWGVTLDASNHNIISGNNITDNYYYGFSIWAQNNTITGNTIQNNWRGIAFGTGGNENRIYHNGFLNNTNHFWFSGSVANIWDDGYPSGGNYWGNDNYADLQSGPLQNEVGSDGIGDVAYTIDVNNVDHYPLMGWFSDHYPIVDWHVLMISNSTISDFNFNGTAIIFNATGSNGTTGFCRICIPTAFMNSTFRVLINGTEVSYNLLPISNETCSYLYFNYTHSTQEVIIIPEFPSFLILPLFMIISLLYVITWKRFTDKSLKKSMLRT